MCIRDRLPTSAALPPPLRGSLIPCMIPSLIGPPILNIGLLSVLIINSYPGNALVYSPPIPKAVPKAEAQGSCACGA